MNVETYGPNYHGRKDRGLREAAEKDGIRIDIPSDGPSDWLALHDSSSGAYTIGMQLVLEPEVLKNRVHLNLVPSAGSLLGAEAVAESEPAARATDGR